MRVPLTCFLVSCSRLGRVQKGKKLPCCCPGCGGKSPVWELETVLFLPFGLPIEKLLDIIQTQPILLQDLFWEEKPSNGKLGGKKLKEFPHRPSAGSRCCCDLYRCCELMKRRLTLVRFSSWLIWCLFQLYVAFTLLAGIHFGENGRNVSSKRTLWEELDLCWMPRTELLIQYSERNFSIFWLQRMIVKFVLVQWFID